MMPASKLIAIAACGVAPGFARWRPPNTAAEIASAIHVPSDSSSRRKSTPRIRISSIVPDASEMNSGTRITEISRVPVMR